jgi:outer membrane protein assembly factor BamB
MTLDLQGSAPAQGTAPRRLGPLIRLLLAWALTLGLLLYAWGRLLILTMLAGRPEPLALALFGGSLAGVLLLTAGLARPSLSPRGRRLIAGGVLGSWVVTDAVLIGLFSGALLPKVVVVSLFVASGLWVVWLAWLPSWPVPFRARALVLAGLLAASPAFPLLLRTEGLTGAAVVNFTWRWARPPAFTGTADNPGGTAHLTAPGPDDFPQYLGPQRLGVLPGAHFGRDWQGQPPREMWRRPLGAGWGGFAVVGDYAFTQEQRGAAECVVCYHVPDGAEVWVHADPVRFEASIGGPGPRATPTVADGRVYTVGATGLLNCLDGATGKALWSLDILVDNGAENLQHGVCGSPLVAEGRVIVSPTGRNGISLAAYDCQTHKRLWQGGCDQASYSSPLLAEVDGVRQVLLYNSAGVAGHDLDTGRVLWTIPWTNYQETNCSQPIPIGAGSDQVYVSTGYGKGSALFRVGKGKSVTWNVEPIWRTGRMQAKFTTPVLYRGRVYGLDDGILACQDLRTGKRLWKEGRYGHGQVLLAGGLLLIQAEDGDVVLVEPAPEGLRELGRMAALSGRTWNVPALAGRRLLVRNDREAACFELPPEKSP